MCLGVLKFVHISVTFCMFYFVLFCIHSFIHSFICLYISCLVMLSFILPLFCPLFFLSSFHSFVLPSFLFNHLSFLIDAFVPNFFLSLSLPPSLPPFLLPSQTSSLCLHVGVLLYFLNYILEAKQHCSFVKGLSEAFPV